MAPGGEAEIGRRGVPSLLGDGGIGQEHIASDVTQANLTHSFYPSYIF
jgi:hypothetical protein